MGQNLLNNSVKSEGPHTCDIIAMRVCMEKTLKVKNRFIILNERIYIKIISTARTLTTRLSYDAAVFSNLKSQAGDA